MKQYKLTKDFAGYKAGDVLNEAWNDSRGQYFNEAIGMLAIHIDIINALPEIFKPVPQKKTVWIGVKSKKDCGAYSTSCAYSTAEEAERIAAGWAVYSLEIEVDD